MGGACSPTLRDKQHCAWPCAGEGCGLRRLSPWSRVGRVTHGETIRGLLVSDVKPIILGLLFTSVPHHTPLPHLPFHLCVQRIDFFSVSFYSLLSLLCHSSSVVFVTFVQGLFPPRMACFWNLQCRDIFRGKLRQRVHAERNKCFKMELCKGVAYRGFAIWHNRILTKYQLESSQSRATFSLTWRNCGHVTKMQNNWEYYSYSMINSHSLCFVSYNKLYRYTCTQRHSL